MSGLQNKMCWTLSKKETIATQGSSYYPYMKGTKEEEGFTFAFAVWSAFWSWRSWKGKQSLLLSYWPVLHSFHPRNRKRRTKLDVDTEEKLALALSKPENGRSGTKWAWKSKGKHSVNVFKHFPEVWNRKSPDMLRFTEPLILKPCKLLKKFPQYWQMCIFFSQNYSDWIT